MRRWIAAGVVLATLLALGGQAAIVARTGFLLGDFRAFYCAARVASYGHDPYRTQPLRACEDSIGPKIFFRKNPGVTIPAPLPGYAIAALAPLSRLSFAGAAIVWVLLLLLAWLAGVAALSRFAGVPWELGLAVLGLCLGTLSLPFGEVVPIAVGCTCIAGYFAWRGRWRAAAIAAAATMIEPHLGMPVCLSLAIFAPPSRATLAVCAAVLAAAALVILGPAVNVEYFTSVLPSHALSELTRDTQYSLSAVLAALSVAPSLALRTGMLWYLVMVTAGVIAGGRMSRQTGNAAWIVCTPPAFAVFGGTFIHITQIAAAAPAALLLATTASARYRTIAGIALLLLTVPWGWVVSPALIVAPLVPVSYAASYLWNGNVKTTLAAACVGAMLVFGLQHLYTIATPHFGTLAHAFSIDPSLPEASWSAYSQRSSGGSLAAWAVRLPTWGGLALLLALIVRTVGWDAPALLFAFVRHPEPFGSRSTRSYAARSRSLRINSSRGTLGRHADRPMIARTMGVVFAIVCVALPIALQFMGDRGNGWLGIDFQAYYCAALSQREGANPYLAQSLHPCEASVSAPYYRAPAGVSVPAPYPPYVFVLLSPLTLLPFGAAVWLWWLIVAGCVGAGAYWLARIVKQPFSVGWAALGLSLGLTSFSSGNMMPLGCAAVLGAAWALHRGRVALGVSALTLAMLEPQIAVPAVLGCCFVFPRSRVPLAAAMALLGALALWGAGWDVAVSYVTAVLPAHALAEVSRDNQYSLATVAGALGVPDAPAALLGTLSYVAMTAVGVVVALRLCRRFEEPALAVVVPPAFALLGGSFVHTAEIATAVPAALLLATRSSALRPLCVAALVLLAVPWMYATSVTTFIAPFFPVAYITYVLYERNRSVALAAACGAFATIASLFFFAASYHPHIAPHAHAYPYIDPGLAEAGWRQFVLGNSTNNATMWLLRAPTWCGLLILAATATQAATRRQPVAAAATA